MANATHLKRKPETPQNLADWVERLGDIPLERIRTQPPLGAATEDDLIEALEAPRKRICELIDGVLVEKPVGTKESLLAGLILHRIWNYLEENDLGVPTGPDGPLRFKIGLVRIPDVSFISWERIPGDEFPDTPIAAIIPDLAIEVLSKGNTKGEMERKLKHYFDAGVRLAWIIAPKTQTAEAYTSPTKKRKIGKDQALDGDDVLPGFTLSLKQLFARANRRRPRR